MLNQPEGGDGDSQGFPKPDDPRLHPEPQLGPQHVDVNRGELLIAIRTDCVTLFAFYLADDLTLEVPDLHIEMWDELLKALDEANLRTVNRVLRKLFAVPRGFAKSTLAKLAAILFLKYSPYKFLLYVSKTNGHAKNALRDVIMWLRSSQEAALFGLGQIEKSSETDSLWIMTIVVRYDMTRPPVLKRVIMKALGADQQVRGLNILNLRPQIVIIDDVEDNDNTTDSLQAGTDTWVMGNLMKALATEAFVMFIGNMIRTTTLLARFSKNPAWNPTVYGAVVRRNGVVESLWEEKFPLANLLAEYEEYRKLGIGHVWEAEMMNLTQDSILAKDLAGVIRPPMPNPEDLIAGCLILDPAYGKEAYHDESAITVHARTRDMLIPMVIDSWHGKAGEEDLLTEMVRLSYYWGITTWFIEATAGQKLFISLFNLLLKERKIPDGIFLMIPISSGGVAKPSRINAFINIVSSGSYAIVDGQQELVDKLAAYAGVETKHEDLEDSAAYGGIVWERFNTVIETKGIQKVALLIANAKPGRAKLNRVGADVASC